MSSSKNKFTLLKQNSVYVDAMLVLMSTRLPTLDYTIVYCILIIIRRRYRANNPRNNYVFVRNTLLILFARRPEMTSPLPAKIVFIEGGMGHAKPSGSCVCHFVFFRHRKGKS